ncbi:TVP38/TMEM64 family protein [Paenibacillus sp. F411]|uniref:TVP38/TMEM64 family protein n=1 Tax=unclassified Paenibacillus TaxID=185978 RepID=UPI001AAEA87D|nr:TVP38/TMEM64 family protein [Paenibacillus sp. F411]MBO2945214.1 TVP38/TMEM64 family protein [Paenibacillus sp. F411]
MVKKIGLALFYLVIAGLIYKYGESILDWFRETDSAFQVIGMATLMALFPMIPYPVVGGLIGAAFGPVTGGLMIWTGSTAASLIMFLFVRYGYQDWGKKALMKARRLEKMTVLFEQNAFLFILFARMVPTIPSIIVNVYSALSRVSFGVYALSSSLGKIPAMLLFVLIGDSLLTEPRNVFITIIIYGLFLAVTIYAYRAWKSKHVSPAS